MNSKLLVRKSEDRGLGDHGWLKSRHTFSFAGYYDEKAMGFGALRVINEDRIAGGTGFGAHPHNDMEIISYVVSGALKHQDSMGNKAVILPGEVQIMSAGTGVRHSEMNDSKDETHFFQIWITPDSQNTKAGYGQKSFEKDLNEKDLVLVVSKNGRDGSIGINQDANIYISRTKSGKEVSFENKTGRKIWVQIIKGQTEINGEKLKAGDAVATTDLNQLKIKSEADSEVMIFDLP